MPVTVCNPIFYYSSVRRFYEQGVSKMISIFPLSDELLQLCPAANPANKTSFSFAQIRMLAEKLLQADSQMLDQLYEEWLAFQLEDEVVECSNIPAFWKTASKSYPTLSIVMQAVICIPHSNATSERVFSMLKKIYTEQRSELCNESITNLLAVKMNTDTCCHDASLEKPLLRKLKQAAMQYNTAHSAPSGSSSVVVLD